MLHEYQNYLNAMFVFHHQFVNNIASGNNVEAEKIFKDVMSQKVGDTLETKRKEMSNTFVKEPEVEETDEV